MSIWNRSFGLPWVILIAFAACGVVSVVTVIIMYSVYTTVPVDEQTETTLSAEDVMRELEVIKQIVSGGDATVVADAEAEVDAKGNVNIAGTIVVIGVLIMLVIGIAVLTIRLSRR